MGPPGSVHIPSICLDEKDVRLSFSVRQLDHDSSGTSVAAERMVSGPSLLVEKPLQLSMTFKSRSAASCSESQSKLKRNQVSLMKVFSERQVFQQRLPR